MLIPELAAKQNVNVKRALASPGQRWVFGDEMGCGKTRQALTMAQHLDTKQLLIVCPAMARDVWCRELTKWWPARSEPCTVDMSPERAGQSKKRREAWPELLTRATRIVSYDLLDPVREAEMLARPGSMVVMDECHALVEPGSGRSKVLRALLRGYRGPIAGLSATPIPNRLNGLWNIIDTIWPFRLGKAGGEDAAPKVPYPFLHRYVEREWKAHAAGGNWQWTSQRQDTAAELRFRLSHMISRITRVEIAHLLPPCQVLPLPVSNAVGTVWWPWLEDAIAGDVSHVMLAFHRRRSVAQVASYLEHRAAVRDGGWTVVATSGEDPPSKRTLKIDQARKAKRSILLTTMHAVKESIDLSWHERALLAELYWRPATLTQFVGRLGRPGGVPSLLHVLCQLGSVNERMASVVSDKLLDAAGALPEGQTEAGLRQALAPTISTEELTKLAMSVVLDDELLELVGLEDDDES